MDPDYQWGYTIGLAYFYQPGFSDIQLSYTRYNKNDQNTANQPEDGSVFSALTSSVLPVTEISDSVFVSFLGAPLPNATASGSFTVPDTQIFFIEARSQFDLYSLNLEFGQKVFDYYGFQLRFHTGLQWTNLSHRLIATATGGSGEDVTFELTGSLVDPNGLQTFVETGLLTFVNSEFTHLFDEKSEFQGAGPCAGISAQYRLNGFSLALNMTTALLIGEIRSSCTEIFNSTFSGVVSGTPTIVSTDPDLVLTPSLAEGDTIVSGDDSLSNFKSPFLTRVVPNINLGIGLNYCSQIPCTSSFLTFEVGYQCEEYWHSMDTYSSVNFANPGFRTHRIENSSLRGPYVRLKFSV